MLDPKTTAIYTIAGQKLTIRDKSYSMTASNTEVTMDGTTMTIKRKE